MTDKKQAPTAKVSLFHKKTVAYGLPDYECQLFADEQEQRRNLKFWSLKRDTFKYASKYEFSVLHISREFTECNLLI